MLDWTIMLNKAHAQLHCRTGHSQSLDEAMQRGDLRLDDNDVRAGRAHELPGEAMDEPLSREVRFFTTSLSPVTVAPRGSYDHFAVCTMPDGRVHARLSSHETTYHVAAEEVDFHVAKHPARCPRRIILELPPEHDLGYGQHLSHPIWCGAGTVDYQNLCGCRIFWRIFRPEDASLKRLAQSMRGRAFVCAATDPSVYIVLPKKRAPPSGIPSVEFSEDPGFIPHHQAVVRSDEHTRLLDAVETSTHWERREMILFDGSRFYTIRRLPKIHVAPQPDDSLRVSIDWCVVALRETRFFSSGAALRVFDPYVASRFVEFALHRLNHYVMHRPGRSNADVYLTYFTTSAHRLDHVLPLDNLRSGNATFMVTNPPFSKQSMRLFTSALRHVHIPIVVLAPSLLRLSRCLERSTNSTGLFIDSTDVIPRIVRVRIQGDSPFFYVKPSVAPVRIGEKRERDETTVEADDVDEDSGDEAADIVLQGIEVEHYETDDDDEVQACNGQFEETINTALRRDLPLWNAYYRLLDANALHFENHLAETAATRHKLYSALATKQDKNRGRRPQRMAFYLTMRIDAAVLCDAWNANGLDPAPTLLERIEAFPCVERDVAESVPELDYLLHQTYDAALNCMGASRVTLFPQGLPIDPALRIGDDPTYMNPAADIVARIDAVHKDLARWVDESVYDKHMDSARLLMLQQLALIAP